MLAVLVLLMIGLVPGNLACPDGTKCQDKNTCCPTRTGYGCCKYQSAVCCSDKAHCCPQGYQCDVKNQLCMKKWLPWHGIPLSPQLPAQKEERNAPAPLVKSDNFSVSVIFCDSNNYCPDSTTCCRTPFGQWTCCPHIVGQCCRDGLHCCPFGFRCDSTSTRCFRGELSLPASPQIAAIQSNTIQTPEGEEQKNVPAPLVKSVNEKDSVVFCDRNNYCPDRTTCCRTPFGRWTCCVHRQGRCCRDGLHCCPSGFRCDSTSTRCFRGELSLPASPQIAAIQSNSIQTPAEEEQKNVPAPLVKSVNEKDSVVFCDSNNYCPDSTTCCRTPFGQWKCCPHIVGQCCRDGLHCCPFGFRCDSTSTRCFRGELSLSASPQIAAIQSNSIQTPAEEEQKNVPAPLVKSVNEKDSVVFCDSNNYCPDSTTCCRTPFGQWTCCPHIVGQCCRDGLHCCPFGFRCDSTSTRCFRGELSLPASPQIAAIQSNSIQTPAEEEQKNVPAPLVKSVNEKDSVVFCDSNNYCPDSTTCCRTPFGQWKCCPHIVGQCCRDGLHCCPFGFRCDSTSTRCFRGELSLSASPQIAAIQSNSIQTPAEEEQKNVPAPLVKSVNEKDSVVFCDSNNHCPDSTTCCRTPFGQWTCCPHIVGQCCRDGLHCCPFGFRCDSTSTRCFRGELSLSASPQIAAIQSNSIQKLPGIIHCSDRFYCPAGKSCCKTPTGQLACCP
ncbi:progranulin-like isoform 2-T2 [Clarias gariepinus]